MKTFQRSLCLVAACGVAILPTALPAQDSGPPRPPSGPLLASAPSYSQWVVEFAYPQPASAPPRPPSPDDQYKTKSITTTKTGQIIHEEIANGLGQVDDHWYIGATQYFRPPGAKSWLESHAGDNGAGMNYSGLPAKGFRDLDWIVASNYIGIVEHAGHQYLVFTQSPSAGGRKIPSADGYQDLDSYALIDISTRYPAEVKLLGAVRTYRFADPPGEKQELPADLAKVIQDGQEMRARLSQPPPRPY